MKENISLAVEIAVLHSIREHFRIEGFRNSAMTGDGGIIHFRKEKTTFTLYISEGTLDFESDRACTALIKSVMPSLRQKYVQYSIIKTRNSKNDGIFRKNIFFHCLCTCPHSDINVVRFVCEPKKTG